MPACPCDDAPPVPRASEPPRRALGVDYAPIRPSPQGARGEPVRAPRPALRRRSRWTGARCGRWRAFSPGVRPQLSSRSSAWCRLPPVPSQAPPAVVMRSPYTVTIGTGRSSARRWHGTGLLRSPGRIRCTSTSGMGMVMGSSASSTGSVPMGVPVIVTFGQPVCLVHPVHPVHPVCLVSVSSHSLTSSNIRS